MTDATNLQGKVMQLFPRALGDHSTLQSVFDAVPDGGTCHIMDNMPLWDLNNNEAIKIDHPMTIIGTGWGHGYSWNGCVVETREGAHHVFDVSNNGKRFDNVNIKGLHITHMGSGAAIYMQDVIHSKIEDILIRCSRIGKIGIDLQGGSFFINTHNVQIRDYVDYGIRDEGNGTQNFFERVHIVDSDSTNPNAYGMYIVGGDKYVMGGEYSNEGQPDNSRNGIYLGKFDSKDSSSGSRVSDFLFEGKPMLNCITIGNEEGVFKGAVLDNIQFQASRGATVFNFRNASHCHVRGFTNYSGSDARDVCIAEFSINSENNLIECMEPSLLGAKALDGSQVSYSEEGGHNNTVRLLNGCTAIQQQEVNDVLPRKVRLKV